MAFYLFDGDGLGVNVLVQGVGRHLGRGVDLNRQHLLAVDAKRPQARYKCRFTGRIQHFLLNNGLRSELGSFANQLS